MPQKKNKINTQTGQQGEVFLIYLYYFSAVFASIPMIPRDETEAVNWKPQTLHKPTLPAIPTPREEKPENKEKQLPSHFNFVTEKFVSNEGVAFFFPRGESNVFNMVANELNCSSKTNVANFDNDSWNEESSSHEDNSDEFQEVVFKEKQHGISTSRIDYPEGRLEREYSPQNQDSLSDKRTPHQMRIPRSKTAFPSGTPVSR